MSVRYRPGSPTRRDRLGALSVSILVGAGAGVVSYYLTRLFLSRERLEPETHRDAAAHLPSGTMPSPTDD